MDDEITFEMATTTSKDVAFVVAILDICKGMPEGLPKRGASIILKSRGYTYDGVPLPKDNFKIEDKIALQKFAKICNGGIFAVEQMRLVFVRQKLAVHQMIDVTQYPVLQISRLGHLYLKSPRWVQWLWLCAYDKGYAAIRLAKQYRWVGTTVGLMYAAYKWERTHDISARLVAATLIIGFGAAMLWGFFLRWAGGDSQMPMDDDMA